MSDLSERYGAPARRRPVVVAGVVLLALVGLAWLGWVALFHGRPQVSSEMVSFSVAGQHEARARFTVVRRDQDVAARCLLRAYADDHSVVGELTVDVGADRDRTATVAAAMRTERRATSVELRGCTAPGQRQPR